ncbi:MAG: pilus assembly protein TadG-related protein, partial [Pseudomonadota bacterium]
MTRWSNISFRFHRFCADGCGNVAIIFALTMPILFGLVGAAIDYGRATDSRTAVSTALDAAVLAAAKKLSMEDASNRDVITFAEGMFLANLNGNNPDLAGRPEFSFTIDRAGNAVRATVMTSRLLASSMLSFLAAARTAASSAV